MAGNLESNIKKYLPSSEFRCIHPRHPGKIPNVWEVIHKCRQGQSCQCQHLLTIAAYNAWCEKKKVFFIGG